MAIDCCVESDGVPVGVSAIYRYSQVMPIFILKVLVEESGVIWERSRIKKSCEAKTEG